MEFTLLLLMILSANIQSVDIQPKEILKVTPKKISVSKKKKNFYKLFVPAIQIVHQELMQEYDLISQDINNSSNLVNIDALKKEYKIKTNKELLMALKPHPQSITLAQAAMESGWATSRFFLEANNVFGMWSSNKNQQRIAAGEKRGGTQTIWLRKFDTIEDSIRAYYKLLATAKAYKEFRELKMQTKNPYELVKKLDKYSEIGALYGEELTKVIRYNNLIQYDK
ncbi:MAG: glucosaminidase domain-containing protein [Campylobacterota bacterium]|nr:glucosaminidase domain-containing protein [Campylobacterota bacterium]